ncbi:MAG: protoporphyrinogen oxidase HemJ [Pseudomonadota bacterium]
MLWIKSLHIIAVICWFAAIFYLPRLFVYHATATDEISNERFKIMERKLFNGIMTPSAIVAIASGLWLLSYGFRGGWLTAKLLLVGIIIIYHGWCWLVMRRFAQDRNQRGHVFYRVMNELPVLLLIPIVILVVVKPF